MCFPLLLFGCAPQAERPDFEQIVRELEEMRSSDV